MTEPDQGSVPEAAVAIAPPRSGRAALYVAVPVGVVLLLLVAILFTRKDFGDSSFQLQDRTAPAIVGETLDGEPFDLDQFRGKWVYVNFFASWCTPCLVEHPMLESFYQQHRQRGDDVELVSVVFADTTENVARFFRDNGGDWPVVAGDNVGRISLDYGVSAPPETFLIDPAGVVRMRHIGQIPNLTFLDDQLARHSRALYGEAGDGAAPEASEPSP